jgi:hypothetical protein
MDIAFQKAVIREVFGTQIMVPCGHEVLHPESSKPSFQFLWIAQWKSETQKEMV